MWFTNLLLFGILVLLIILNRNVGVFAKWWIYREWPSFNKKINSMVDDLHELEKRNG
jgi:hypothetical protein